MLGIVQVAGLGMAPTKFAKCHTAFVHHTHQVGLGALTKPQLVRGHDGAFELGVEFLVAQCCHHGAHLGGLCGSFVGLGLISDQGRLFVVLMTDLIECAKGKLGFGFPCSRRHLPLAEAAASEVHEELVPRRQERCSIGTVIGTESVK